MYVQYNLRAMFLTFPLFRTDGSGAPYLFSGFHLTGSKYCPLRGSAILLVTLWIESFTQGTTKVCLLCSVHRGFGVSRYQVTVFEFSVSLYPNTLVHNFMKPSRVRQIALVDPGLCSAEFPCSCLP